MNLDLERFYEASNPAEPIDMKNPEEKRYYIDFAAVRGDKVIKALKRVISRLSPNKPTCQLFTGHIGCGKSTELSRLQTELEVKGFHVVYFEATEDLDYIDVDVSDILLAIARQVSASLEESNIKLKAEGFKALLKQTVDFLKTPIDLSVEGEFAGVKGKASTEKGLEISLPVVIGKITAKAKGSQATRSKLRQFMEPQTTKILKLIDEEIISIANEQLKKRGQKGLVVIVDNLDRIPYRKISYSNKALPVYLFVEKGEQLRKINCHLVYTLPMVLIYSNERQEMEGRLGGGIETKVLPMVPTKLRNGEDFYEGMELLRQMVLTRAFPELTSEERSGLITEVFDRVETLDRLCRISGGHPRNLLGMLFGCLQQEDPPISADTLESVIRSYRDRLLLNIDDEEWELLFEVDRTQRVKGEKEYQALLPSLFVFEYHDREGTWFGLNPLLLETKKYRTWKAENL
ncbi:MAG: ATP-binding protein [Cyanobacteriota bacterium]|nr:ATP-binding protein [Cyanobacteriota bacterium]